MSNQLEIRELGLDGVLEICPPKFSDERGFFSETYNGQRLAEAGVRIDFVQDNHSLSVAAGVLRGLHYQLSPKAQDKLLRVVSGAIFDVAVDIRRSSPTFGKWVGVELSAQKWNQIFIPRGFAHGFLTLSPNTEVIYKVSDYHAVELDRSIRFDDPQIGVKWPLPTEDLTLSQKDRQAPLLAQADLFD